MAAKRPHSPELVPNPFIKKRNLEWSIELEGSSRDALVSDEEDGNPKSASSPSPSLETKDQDPPKPAAVEPGKAQITDHLAYFSNILQKATQRPSLLSTAAYSALYAANAGSAQGAHFVIHQHDHPVAGTHYDLRLQINGTSSASWAIMYGVPGDPNSRRLNRNATETRVHCLWNHLIETASVATGSLLIWDTGTYSVLAARRSKHAPAEDPDSADEGEEEGAGVSGPDEEGRLTEQQKLHAAFQTRKIRLRLHGARLPQSYVLNLRLTKSEDAAGRAKSTRKPKTRRRRGGGGGGGQRKAPEPMTTSSEESGGDDNEEDVKAPAEEAEGVSAMEREIRELEDDEVRRTNAYPGATNSIGSVYQRRWYLSLDRDACGFVKHRKKGRVIWERADDNGKQQQQQDDEETGKGQDGRLTFPFDVEGADVERSVVTGRQGADVLRDEGVVGFVRRKGWRPVLD